MNTITIKNLSTYTDFAVLIRVAKLMAGDEHFSTHDGCGKEVVRIIHRGDTYTVVDK